MERRSTQIGAAASSYFAFAFYGRFWGYFYSAYKALSVRA